ncbi:hypothetical protein BLA60_08675 [Actinophytocola xinjiangensis]|uniref:Uncharacterized protein n=1 Tax=Actinophytocola xinjiangensis TaxID=485602 RepID=A0A7Z1AZK5_9PSEU|nr:hypothetical protein [Actinophytocola xinjiangensis]OLF12085.1 hypothetical protein BLA60_08675 [Actinophytocola xinjiangensis]
MNLDPAADRIGTAHRAAEAGTVRIDLDSAYRLLDELAALREHTAELVTAGPRLDRPLRFGDNWVGHALSRRLRGVAVNDRGLTPALAAFHALLDDVAATVRLAAGLYDTTDHDAAGTIGRAAP